MDEFISLILQGIQSVKDLEPITSLQSFASQQDMVSKLDEIIRVFFSAREKLNAQDPSLYPQMLFRELQQIAQSSQDPYNWLRNKSMMELFQTQLERKTSSGGSGGGTDHIASGGGLAMEVGGGSADVQPDPVASSSLQRPRRRKDDAEKRTQRVPAPRMGNTEIPPEDGYTWRKYGQKEILGSKYPRGYYRCTHQKLYHCPAKKQVQRLDDDPYTFEVTYRGEHTCHMSATAPSIPPAPELTQEMAHPMAVHPLQWLEFSLGGGAGTGSGASSSSGAGAGAGAGTGPSTVRYGKEGEFPVADLADVMFNSGSSSSNSMELIFTSTSMELDKWEQQGDKKN